MVSFIKLLVLESLIVIVHSLIIAMWFKTSKFLESYVFGVVSFILFVIPILYKLKKQIRRLLLTHEERRQSHEELWLYLKVQILLYFILLLAIPRLISLYYPTIYEQPDKEKYQGWIGFLLIGLASSHCIIIIIARGTFTVLLIDVRIVYYNDNDYLLTSLVLLWIQKWGSELRDAHAESILRQNNTTHT